MGTRAGGDEGNGEAPLPKGSARLWVVRHGETDWNAAGRIQGHLRTELNARGRAQARELAGWFAGRRFGAVYASDLPRAVQTAEILAERLGLGVRTREDLRERALGAFEGKTTVEIRAMRAGAVGSSNSNISNNSGIGGGRGGDLANWTGVAGVEGDEALWGRVEGAMKGIAEAHGGEDVLVVTHGGVISRIIYKTLGIAEGCGRRFSLANGIVAVVEWREGAWFLLSLADMGLVRGGGASVDTASAGR